MNYTIAYASDHNYIGYLLLSMGTLLEANKDAGGIKLYVVESGMTPEDKERLIELVSSRGRELELVPFGAICRLDKETGNFSKASYSRLFLDKVCPEERVLYLDVDTVVTGSLEDLFEWEFSDGAVGAAVLDMVHPEFRTGIGLGRENPYYNSGVILWNLRRVREERIGEQLESFVKGYYRREGRAVPHNDQGAFNAVCAGRLDTLPARFNMMSGTLFFSAGEAKRFFRLGEYYPEEELSRDKENPVILHFTEGYYGRPWNVHSTHPFKELFRRRAEELGLPGELDRGRLPLRRKITVWARRHLSPELFSLYWELVDRYRKVRKRC